ncbi:copper transporter family [Stylonychia lemnae]|uniref:Copper transport protein n=1 Tax=Stylonychia lemnae TaxID=5949 RepID=A0A078AAY3_STYLE|nr:copper transporter family [Stylonychia lemnae]|eukprot:CDW79415.1 copper transporter family [Stylonychia lemnae]
MVIYRKQWRLLSCTGSNFYNGIFSRVLQLLEIQYSSQAICASKSVSETQQNNVDNFRLIEYEEDNLSIPPKIKLVLGFIYLVSCVISYLLLLLAFQLDFGIFLAILCGYTIGYTIFGFKRRRSYIYLYNPKSDKCQFEIEI